MLATRLSGLRGPIKRRVDVHHSQNIAAKHLLMELKSQNQCNLFAAIVIIKNMRNDVNDHRAGARDKSIGRPKPRQTFPHTSTRCISKGPSKN